MKLIKDNEIIELKNEAHVAAFRKAGWVDYVEPVKKPAKKTKKQE